MHTEQSSKKESNAFSNACTRNRQRSTRGSVQMQSSTCARRMETPKRCMQRGPIRHDDETVPPMQDHRLYPTVSTRLRHNNRPGALSAAQVGQRMQTNRLQQQYTSRRCLRPSPRLQQCNIINCIQPAPQPRCVQQCTGNPCISLPSPPPRASSLPGLPMCSTPMYDNPLRSPARCTHSSPACRVPAA